MTDSRGKNNEAGKNGTLVISPGTSSDAKDSKTEKKITPVERVTVYQWEQYYSAPCCPNCEAEIKKNEKQCKACGWILENR